MSDDIVRPVTLKSESFPGVRIIVADPQPPQVRGIGGSVSTRAEYVTGYSHDFTDANGAWLATAHCSPEVAEIMLASLNAAGPRNLVIDTTNAAMVSVDQGQGAVPLPTAFRVPVTAEMRPPLEPPPHLFEDDTPDTLEDQAATQTFAERYGVDVEALTDAFLRAAVDVPSGEVLNRLAVEAGIRALLAALGMEARRDG